MISIRTFFCRFNLDATKIVYFRKFQRNHPKMAVEFSFFTSSSPFSSRLLPYPDSDAFLKLPVLLPEALQNIYSVEVQTKFIRVVRFFFKFQVYFFYYKLLPALRQK